MSPAQRELPGNRRQRRQRDRDSATREEDGACRGAARHGGTGLSWKRRGRRGRAGAQILQRGSAPPQGHCWSSLSLPSMKTHQKSVYGVCLAMPPLPQGPCPVAMRDSLQRDQAAGPGMGTSWGWHQSCRSPDEAEPGASPRLWTVSAAPLFCAARPAGAPRGPPLLQRGAVGARAQSLWAGTHQPCPPEGRTPCPPIPLLHPSPVTAVCNPNSALWDSHPPLPRLPAHASRAKSQRASPVICSEPAGSRHSINVLRQGLPFASKVPNSRGVGVVLTFMCYL